MLTQHFVLKRNSEVKVNDFLLEQIMTFSTLTNWLLFTLGTNVTYCVWRQAYLLFKYMYCRFNKHSSSTTATLTSMTKGLKRLRMPNNILFFINYKFENLFLNSTKEKSELNLLQHPSEISRQAMYFGKYYWEELKIYFWVTDFRKTILTFSRHKPLDLKSWIVVSQMPMEIRYFTKVLLLDNYIKKQIEQIWCIQIPRVVWVYYWHIQFATEKPILFFCLMSYNNTLLVSVILSQRKYNSLRSRWFLLDI